MSKITVVDSMMGLGKSSWAYQYINSPENRDNMIYITPFLDEVSRAKKACKFRMLIEPENDNKTKLEDLKKLIDEKQNIASTHNLFKIIDEECIEKFRFGHYTLILDEVLDAIEPVAMRKGTAKLLEELEAISIDEKGFVHWKPGITEEDTDFDNFISLVKTGRVVCVNEMFYIWRFPPEVFEIFDEVYILTYMFDSTIMFYYFEMNRIEYSTKSVSKLEDETYHLVPYYKANPARLRNLIHIYKGPRNYQHSLRRKYSLFTKTWFTEKAKSSQINELKNRMRGFFETDMKADTDDIMWTCYKDYAPKLARDDKDGFRYIDENSPKNKGKKENRCWVPFNKRSTNKYSNKHVLAYCVDPHPHVYLERYINEELKKQHRRNRFDRDKYALSEMLQWIWRSAVRNGEEINIYIPSPRMRELLESWLKNEI